MSDRCPSCGLERWHSTADVGGCLPPDDESQCFGGRTCRLVASGYQRGREERPDITPEDADIWILSRTFGGDPEPQQRVMDALRAHARKRRP